MMLAWIPVLLSLGAATPETLHFGIPAIDDARFEMTVDGPEAQLQQATTEVTGNRAYVVVPDTRAESDRMSFETGPVEQLRISRRQGSTIIAFWLRLNEGQGAPSVQLVAGESWSVRVVMPEPAAAAVEASEAVPAPVEVAKAAPIAQAERAAPFLAKAPAGPRASTLMAVLGIAMLIAFVLASWWRRRRGVTAGQVDAASIDILAVRALGGKHKLAVVQTCGERMLVACSDRGVRLLSHLGAGDVGIEAVARPESNATPTAGLSDIQGLVHLRQTGRTQAIVVPDDGVAA